MAKFNQDAVTKVEVEPGLDNQFSLGCEYLEGRYHVWVYRNGHELQDNKLYKNSVAARGTPGHFECKTLRADAEFGKWLIGEMRRWAHERDLWAQAELKVIAKREQDREERKERIAKRRAQEAGPELLKAAQGALLLLQSIQQAERQLTSEHDQLPYPEIVELEDAINLALEGRDDADTVTRT